MQSREEHPVWRLYDHLRTARLNVKYYRARLYRVEQVNFILEFILLVTAPSSAVASLWFWHTSLGEIIWRYFGIVAALAAVLKPFLSSSKKIKAYSEILTGYRNLENDLSKIEEQVLLSRAYDRKLQQDFLKALDRKKDLSSKDPDSTENQALRRKFTAEVNKELPSERFFVPGQ